MTVFWQDAPLNEHQLELLGACLGAHELSAMRPNVSTEVLQLTAGGSLDYGMSLSAALSTIGGVHAPLTQSYDWLVSTQVLPEKLVRVPGWGSSFEKGKPDSIWMPVQEHIYSNYPNLKERIEKITEWLHGKGKKIYPNASCFTAATGIALKMPKATLPWLFVQGRLRVWSALFMNQLGLKEN